MRRISPGSDGYGALVCGDDGDLRGMKRDGGNVHLELIVDDPHDRRVKCHADPQEGEPVSFSLRLFPNALTASVLPLRTTCFGN